MGLHLTIIKMVQVHLDSLDIINNGDIKTYKNIVVPFGSSIGTLDNWYKTGNFGLNGNFYITRAAYNDPAVDLNGLKYYGSTTSSVLVGGSDGFRYCSSQGGETANGVWSFMTDTKFLVSNSGLVGIGTSTPSQRLDVNGNINISTGGQYLINGQNIDSKYLAASGTALNAFNVPWAGITGKPNVLYTASGDGTNNTNTYINTRVIQNTNSTTSNDGLWLGYQNTNSGITRVFGGGAVTGGIVVSGSGINDASLAGYQILSSGNYSSVLNSVYLGISATATNSTNLNNQNAAYYLNYANLTNTPVIPAAQINTDWTSTSGVNMILNKPATFTPSVHNHSATEITSGTLVDSRLSSNVALKDVDNFFSANVNVSYTNASTPYQKFRVTTTGNLTDFRVGTLTSDETLLTSEALKYSTASGGLVSTFNASGLTMNNKSISGIPTTGQTSNQAISVTQADATYEKKTLSGSVTVNTAIPAGSFYTTTITVTGANVGDVCVHELQTSDFDSYTYTKAVVISANTVKIWVVNTAPSGSTSYNSAFKVKVFK
jgi:hypothetical protein